MTTPHEHRYLSPSPAGHDSAGHEAGDPDRCARGEARPELCGICKERPATLEVAVFASATRASDGKPTRTGTEHWCAPCRDRVFPPGKEYAWKHRDDGWVGEGKP